MNVPITSLTATDDVAVAAYLVKESSGTPPAASSGWTATAPTSYAFGSAGSKTLYAWAKDAAGNVSASRSASVNITLPDMANAVISFAASQLLDTADQLQPGNYPRSSLPDGTWRTEDTRGWTSGFFEGLMWKMYEHTGDQDWATLARSWSAFQTENQFNTGTHDIGFQLMRSFGDGYRLTGDPGYRKALLNGAGSLARRFNPAVGSIKSWDWADWWEYPVIIDNMMNLELLFFAAELDGGDARWNQIAHQHALTTMRDHVRPDGSTYHVVNYNPDTGAVLSRETWQGADDDSTWARGQAWAIHGFTTAYRYTDDPRLLATAERVADYFIAHLPSDGIPYWDFQAPGIPRTNRDSSAAAIAASGLEELKDYVSPVKAEEYRGIATQILQTLSSSDYLAEGSNSPGIVLHGVGSFPAGTEVDVSLIYGDYYFIEALLRDRGEGL